MADDLVTVASTAPMPIRIQHIDPDVDPAHQVADPPTAVINGTGHPDSVGGVGVTHGIPREMFDCWLAAYPHYRHIMRVISQDEHRAMADPQASSGWEPALRKAAEQGDDQKPPQHLSDAASEVPQSGPPG